MQTLFDIHNHLFNRHFLAKELLFRLTREMKKLIVPELEQERGLDDSLQKLRNVIKALKRYSHAIRVFTRRNSTAIYEELNKVYKGKFILTPLTFDLTYCFAPSADRNGAAASEPSVNEYFDGEMESLFRLIEQQAALAVRDRGETIPEEGKVWKEYLLEKEKLIKNAEALREVPEARSGGQPDMRGFPEFPGPFDGFEEQIRQIRELKENPDCRDMIYPFLAVDPRRPGILEYARNNTGRGKLFAGIKLYCPNGYSPTDPLLYGTTGQKDGLYAFCEENGIPVTAHNSDGGFATLSKSVFIHGLIHDQGELVQLENERLNFSGSILSDNAVYERAVALNHPLLWEKVVEKYPGLILNLAHFGGGGQLEKALENPNDHTLWSNRIISLLKDGRYKVYTDLSCFTEFGILRKFVDSPVYDEIKGKILYGSDYTLLLLFEDDFPRNVKQFRQCFGNDFEIIAGANPREFLKHVIG